MKILDLDLLAFGPFTDVNLVFPDNVGMHVIYGPNEAGKSSALRALIALLYGIDHNTTDAFIHDYKKLRIGGKLRNADDLEIAFIRRKGRKNTLLSPTGESLRDDALRGFLHGVNRELFQSIFGINHDELVEGSKDILQGAGEVGQSLFAAGLGSGNLRGLLVELENEAGELFLPRGQRTITNAINNYNNLKIRISKISLSSREWSEHVRSLESAEARLDSVKREIHLLNSEQNRLQRLQAAIPNIGRRRDNLTKLEEYQDVPILTERFSEERHGYVTKLETAREILAISKPALDGHRERLKGITIPSSIIDHEETILELYERRGAYRKALADLPGLETEKNQLEDEARSLLSEVRPDLAFEQAHVVKLSAVERSKIQELGMQHQAITERLQKAEDDVANLRKELKRTQGKLDSMPAQRDPFELKRLVDRIKRQGELENLLSQASEELNAVEYQANIELKKLPLWSGALQGLESLPVPLQETIDRFEKGLHERGNKVENLAVRITEVEESIAELDRQIEELRLSGAVPTEEELFASRERRDLGWKIIRREWLDKEDITIDKIAFDPKNDLPEAYEKSVTEADRVGDRLRREADRVASQASILSEKSKKADLLKALGEEMEGLKSELSGLLQEWQSAWAASGIEPLTPLEMRSWTAKQNDLARQSEEVRGKRQQAEGLKETIERHKIDLGEVLHRLGEPQPGPKETLEMLLDRCDEVINAIEELSAERKTLENKIKEINADIKEAEQESESASGKLREWQAQWAAAMKVIGLNGNALPSEAYSTTDKVGELSQNLAGARNIKGRIDGINRDSKKLLGDIAALIEHIAPDLKKLPGDQAVVDLHSRLGRAQSDSAVVEELKDQIKEREKEIREAEGVIELMGERLAGMCDQAGCSDYTELEAIEIRSADYQRLKENLAIIEEQLLEQSAGKTVEELVKEAEGVDKDSLPGQVEDLSEKIAELERERDGLQETVWEERNYLRETDGNDQAALAAEEAQEVLSGVREYVMKYVRLKMASSILKMEIERYRRENQGPLLSMASRLFSQLTRGSFSGLQVDYNEKDEPILVGVRPSGEIVGVNGMSDGTRDQLYLSLRLASLEKYLESNESIPFVVDDVLIKFDDVRSEATLEVLAQLSDKTQVIFFTHHNHLVELSEKVGGEKVKVHML